MDKDLAIATLNDAITDVDRAMNALESADPDFQLSESHRGLMDAFDGMHADLSRLRAGLI